jgi:hypothetical protein
MHLFEQVRSSYRGPQSTQSEPMPSLQEAYSAPGPPSSHEPSEAASEAKKILQVFEQVWKQTSYPQICPTVPRSWYKISKVPRKCLASMDVKVYVFFRKSMWEVMVLSAPPGLKLRL